MGHGSECIEVQFSWREVLQIWQKFLPPIRPSIKDQQVYEHYIKKIKPRQGSKVLILGVTPEVRKLALKHCCWVIAIDFHTVMIKAMNRLISDLEYSKSNEVIVKGDWLAMPFRREEFDLILSDCSLNSLTKTETKSLLKELKRLLKKDGYICMRIIIFPDKWKQQSILDILKMNRRKHQKNSEKIFEDLYLQILCSIDIYDSISRRSSISKARKEWRKLYSNNEISRQEFEAFESVLSKGNYSPVILRRSELEELLNRHFLINGIKKCGSKSIGFSPIYCLKSK